MLTLDQLKQRERALTNRCFLCGDEGRYKNISPKEKGMRIGTC